MWKVAFLFKKPSKIMESKVLKKCEEFSSVMSFLSCKKWKSFWGFLASSSHSFCLWDLFLFSDFFFVIWFLCVLRSTDFMNLALKRLTGVHKLARNLLKEICYIDYMTFAFYTFLYILLLFQGMGWKKEKIIEFEIGYGVFLRVASYPHLEAVSLVNW